MSDFSTCDRFALLYYYFRQRTARRKEGGTHTTRTKLIQKLSISTFAMKFDHLFQQGDDGLQSLWRLDCS